MSAGAFVRSKYAADYGAGDQIHPIRVQPETISLVIDSEDNDPPSGDISNPISAVVSNSRRKLGLTPRIITLQLPATGQPTGYKPSGIVRVPALNRTIFDAAQKGDEATYLGVTCIVVSKSTEIAQ
jgi:hypothetical protein